MCHSSRSSMFSSHSVLLHLSSWANLLHALRIVKFAANAAFDDHVQPSRLACRDPT